jgi:hypothetical protein
LYEPLQEMSAIWARERHDRDDTDCNPAEQSNNEPPDEFPEDAVGAVKARKKKKKKKKAAADESLAMLSPPGAPLLMPTETMGHLGVDCNDDLTMLPTQNASDAVCFSSTSPFEGSLWEEHRGLREGRAPGALGKRKGKRVCKARHLSVAGHLMTRSLTIPEGRTESGYRT